MSTRSKTRVLFVGHDASRTGAPILLLHFLRWLSTQEGPEFEILLKNGGELVPEYAAIAPTRVLHTSVGSSLPRRLIRRIQRMVRGAESRAAALARRYPAKSYPLIYSNTVANGDLVGLFGRRGHRIICHAHEMRFGIERWGGPAAQASAAFIDSLVAASNAVKRDVINQLGVSESKIEVIHEFGQPVTATSAAQSASRERVRRELAIGADDIVVGMCGTMDWRKGADIFPLLAQAVVRRSTDRNYRFVWLGQPPGPIETLQLNHDRTSLGLGDRIHFLGQVPNPQDYMSAFDIFALTSREDPCPLVMIEAGSLGLPIVCFADSGGATDFVGNDAGAIVPYLDLDAMAAAIVRLGADKLLRTTQGRNGQLRAATGFTLQTQAPKLLAVIERHLA
ncbi:MAG TPA: glycosyltransferase family 4 protein [Opitutaceae bacterium]|nr:glycosyltransferase family 4 protein [Opitutaceae bacterium]